MNRNGNTSEQAARQHTMLSIKQRMMMRMPMEAMAMPWPGCGAFVTEEIS